MEEIKNLNYFRMTDFQVCIEVKKFNKTFYSWLISFGLNFSLLSTSKDLENVSRLYYAFHDCIMQFYDWYT